MSLLDSLGAPPAERLRGTRCSVATLYASLTGQELDAVRREIEGTRLDGADLSRRLRANGIRLSAQTISRHRRRNCLCDVAD